MEGPSGLILEKNWLILRLTFRYKHLKIFPLYKIKRELTIFNFKTKKNQVVLLKGWRLFDDQNVMPVNETEISKNQKDAYVLIYKLRNNKIKENSTFVDISKKKPATHGKTIIHDADENLNSISESDDEYYEMETDECEEIKDSYDECEESDYTFQKKKSENISSKNIVFTHKLQTQDQQTPPLNIEVYTNLNDLD